MRSKAEQRMIRAIEKRGKRAFWIWRSAERPLVHYSRATKREDGE